MKKIATLALSLCFASAFLAGAAHAGPAAASVAVTAEDEILWTTASVEAPEIDSLEIRIMTPKGPGKKRSVFQKCVFNVQGAGDYRCGIDVATGSIASKLSGKWLTKVLVNGAVADSTGFSL